jgi:hypothetical protein
MSGDIQSRRSARERDLDAYQDAKHDTSVAPAPTSISHLSRPGRAPGANLLHGLCCVLARFEPHKNRSLDERVIIAPNHATA